METNLIIAIVFILLVAAGAFFASFAMNIWSRVFLSLVVVCASVVIFFTAAEFKIRSTGQKAVITREKKLSDEQERAKKTLEGSKPNEVLAEKSIDEMSMEDVRLTLLALRYEQKHAWFGCKPGAIKADGKELNPIQLGGGLPATPPENLESVKLLEVPLVMDKAFSIAELKGIVYVFDQGKMNGSMPSGPGAFLGVFSVEEKNGNNVTLHSAVEFNEAEIQQITKSSKNLWAVYSSMPQDSVRLKGELENDKGQTIQYNLRSIFNLIPQDILESVIPNKKLRDELTAEERPLNDYAEAVRKNYEERVEYRFRMKAVEQDIQDLDASIAKAKQEENKLRDDIDLEKLRIQQMETQLKAVQDKVAEYQSAINGIIKELQREQQKHEWYVARIAEYQLEVKQKIETAAQAAAQ